MTRSPIAIPMTGFRGATTLVQCLLRPAAFISITPVSFRV
jgi:hypothetical protein